MTILSADTLLDVLNLIADGATVAETTAAIGAAPKSKIIFAWLADSEAAGEFDPPPDPESKWCTTWRDKLEWFHLHYRTAVADGKNVRALRKTPLRAELESRLALKRAASPPPRVPSAVQARDEVGPRVPQMIAQGRESQANNPPKPEPTAAPRPSYAYRRAPPLDAVNTPAGPPLEGRFTVATHSYSRAERQAGKPSITDEGIKWN